MLAKAHLLFSSGAWMAGCALIGHSPTVAETVVMLAGALAPDIDHPSSKVGRMFSTVSRTINKFGGHRGFTHSVFILVPIIFIAMSAWDLHVAATARPGLFGLFGAREYGHPSETWQGTVSHLLFAFCFGYFSHLLGDVVTRQGLRLLWPLPIVFRLTPFYANSSPVSFIAFAAFVAGSWFFGVQMWETGGWRTISLI